MQYIFFMFIKIRHTSTHNKEMLLPGYSDDTGWQQ